MFYINKLNINQLYKKNYIKKLKIVNKNYFNL